MVPQSRCSRRKALALLGASVIGGIAGCSQTNPDPPETRTSSASSSTRRTTRTDTTAETTDTPTSSATATERPITTSLGELCSGTEQRSGEDGVWFTLLFDQAVTDSDGRPVAVRCDSMTMHGGTGHELETYDIGVPDNEPTFIEGAYEPETNGDRTYRPFGKRVTVKFTEYPRFLLHSGVSLTIDAVTEEIPLPMTVCTDEPYETAVEKSGWHQKYVGFHGGPTG